MLVEESIDEVDLKVDSIHKDVVDKVSTTLDSLEDGSESRWRWSSPSRGVQNGVRLTAADLRVLAMAQPLIRDSLTSIRLK